MTFCAAFHTALGHCALAWREDAIVGAALPGGSEEDTMAWMVRRWPGAVADDPPAWVGEVIHRVRRLLDGVPVRFSDVPLSFDGAAQFERQVYQATLAIPHGETRTYGELARAITQPGAARAVGRALGRNPIPIIVPCHRVLAASGGSGGFSAPGGVSTKMRLLQIERAGRGDQPSLFSAPLWSAAPARA